MHSTLRNTICRAPVDGGYREQDYWIWCGSAFRGGDGRYHMFASRISKEFHFSPHWVTNSEVVPAVSDTLEGPYDCADLVLPPRDPSYWDGQMTPNPTIHFHDGPGGYSRASNTWNMVVPLAF